MERPHFRVRIADVLQKLSAVFESYWNSGNFVPYDPEAFAQATARKSDEETFALSPIELRLEPFQERLLEEIATSRESKGTIEICLSQQPALARQ